MPSFRLLVPVGSNSFLTVASGLAMTSSFLLELNIIVVSFSKELRENVLAFLQKR